MLVVALATPLFMLAEGTPAVTNFTVTGPFVAGSKFTISVGNVSDFGKSNPTVTLNGLALTVSAASKGTIQGTLPKGVSAKGGSMLIKFAGQTIDYTLYVPYIDNLFLPKIAKDAPLLINGGNFSEDCKIGLLNSSLAVTKITQRQIFATIGSKLDGGGLTVSCKGLTSPLYPFDFTPPEIIFVENKDGIFPGGTVTLHAKGLSSSTPENQIFLDSRLLTTTNSKPADGTIQAKLPDENAKGSLKLVVNGIESDGLSLDANFPPILTDYKFSEEGGKKVIKLLGKNFASDPSKVSVKIANKSAKVLFSNVSNIQAEIPKDTVSGCIMVEIYSKSSNCLAYESAPAPFLKGYMEPVQRDENDGFEWILFATGVSDNLKDVQVKGSEKFTLKSKTLNQITVWLESIPEKGEVYVVSKGAESNHVAYDFSQRFYPYISSVSAASGFKAGFPVTIKGNNFGRHSYRKNLKVNVGGGELAKIDKEYDWKIEPTLIVTRLNDKKQLGDKVTFSVTRKGKKSNEVSTKTGTTIKEAQCSPWAQQVLYPNGIIPGSTIRILGHCFNTIAEKNQVSFDGTITKGILTGENFLDVIIPKTALKKGKLSVVDGDRKGNSVEYVSAPGAKPEFSFNFADLPSKTLEINKDGSVAKLVIKNTLGEVQIQTLKLYLAYEDDKSDPNSTSKTGVLPFDTLKFKFSGKEKITIDPMPMVREGSNLFSITLKGLAIHPSPEEQSLEITTTVKPFALNNSKFYFTFDPSKEADLSALNLHRSTQNLMKFGQKAIKSSAISITKAEVTCFDSDSKKVNCDKFMGIPTAQPESSPKPKLPGIPTK